ncbi:hypothetical protein niasHS_015023 [Heterodera schachtii]|uniref:Uncharacterized protein n=1 Tax=Heterodera schachtii TaxID=97005 RepID=A0ABD2ILM3_HETSC
MGESKFSKKFFLTTIQQRWRQAAIGSILILAGIFLISVSLYFLLGSIIEIYIRKTSVLTEGTIILSKWSDPTYFIRTQMYTFTVRNPDEITHGAIPSVKRQGPYSFDQIQKRKIHQIVNGTVQFETLQSYHFNEEASCAECFLYNRIWIPNLVYQKFVEAASKPAMRPALAAVAMQTPFLEVEVAELLYDGYKDPFLDQICSLPVVNFVCEQILHLPDRIGLFYKKNGTANGVFVVEDGHTENSESLGRILSWKGSKSLPDYWWEGDQALQINGTDGSLLPPYIDKSERLRVFVADMCRSLDFVFQKEVEYDGVKAYRFVVPKDNWDWSLDWNKGFCNSDNPKKFFPEQNSADCLPSGLLDVSRCQPGEPPVVISQPNFLYAPEFVQKSIDGIRQPVQELDQIEIDIEPRLGTLLQAHRRFLISISMWHGVNITLSDLKNFRNSIVPVLEVDEHIHIDEPNLNLIKTKLVQTEKFVSSGCIFTAILSLVAIAVVSVIFIRRQLGSSNSEKFSSPAAVAAGGSRRSGAVSPIPLSVPKSNGTDLRQ